MLNKKAQGLSTTTMILLVLGILVLVVLVLGFTIGWNKLAPWLSSNNVDSVVTSCEVACTTGSTYGFCFQERDLKADNEELEGVTCNYLNQQHPNYGINECPSISCNVVYVDTLDEAVCEGNEGKTVQALVDNKLESKQC